jgi:hypothetical protein
VHEKVYLGIPMEYVEVYTSRAGFVLLHDGKGTLAHSMRLHLGCITGMSKVANVYNEIELGMVISMIIS